MPAESAAAKINLFLHVLGKRDDGYHELQSLCVFTDKADKLEFAAADKPSLKLTGEFADALLAEGEQGLNDNLVIQAARLLATEFDVRQAADITLEKNLPVASGIGGGSADAAAALRALNALWQCGADEEKLETMAAQLGSDVPVCLRQETCYLGGRGERVQPIKLPKFYWLVLVNPGVKLSTANIFSHPHLAISEKRELPTRFDSHETFLTFLKTTRNDLQTAAMECCPEIGVRLGALLGTPECLLARMSGSGATCFGLYEGELQAEQAVRQLRSAYPKDWICATALR